MLKAVKNIDIVMSPQPSSRRKAEGEHESEEGVVTTSSDGFSVFIQLLTREAQQRHGLRHGDYQRYRNYCSRRIRRIRQKIGFSNQVVKHRLVHVRNVEPEIVTDARHLHLVLFSAERAWSYAMQLKAEANLEPRKRFHMIGRLRKAAAHATLFISLCESVGVDARTKLEAQAYLANLQGLMAFELKSWEECRESLTKARTIFEKLSEALSGEQRAIYIARAEELLPLIRYASYNIGDESAATDLLRIRMMRTTLGGGAGAGADGAGAEDLFGDKLDELIAQTRAKQAASMADVTWMNRTAPVKNERVRVFLMEFADADKAGVSMSNQERLVILERINKQCIDAIQALRDDLLKTDPIFKAASQRGALGSLTPAEVSDGTFVFSYLCYIRYSKSIERALLTAAELRHHLGGAEAATQAHDVAAASSSFYNQTTGAGADATAQAPKQLAKPQDLVRLYDLVLQNLTELQTLPGLPSPNLLSEFIALQGKYRAVRCFYLARSYGLMRKFSEAFALYNRCADYTNEAISSCSALQNLSADVVELKELLPLIEADKQACRAASLIVTTSASTSLTTESYSQSDVKLPLVERLDRYVEAAPGSTNGLVRLPPDFDPVACKPLFFDLALNYIDLPPLEDLTAQARGSGLLGSLGGWLWRKK